MTQTTSSEKAARLSVLAPAKLASTKLRTSQVRVNISTDEVFTYEGGKLVEYEYTLPPEYLEYPDKDS